MNRLGPLLIAMLLWPAGTASAEQQPSWSFEIMGGIQDSSIEEWSTFYGDDQVPQFGLSFAYKLLRVLEIGIETSYLWDDGQGFAPGHGTVAGDVKYQLLPVQATITLRGILYEDQWLVPYLGAAAGRYSYRVTVEGGDRISGGTDGTSYRAGLQFLLDRLDTQSAESMKRYYGIDNTYLFLEARDSEAEVDGDDLGGTAYLGGLLFEF